MEPVNTLNHTRRLRVEPRSKMCRRFSHGWSAVWFGLFWLVLLAASQDVTAQFPSGMIRPGQSTLLPSSTPPPVLAQPELAKTETLDQYRYNAFKRYLSQASQPEYRFVDGQMYDLQALVDFAAWRIDLPNDRNTVEILKNTPHPLPNWALLYGRVAQVIDRNSILLWQYDQPEMVSNPKLIRLRNYPLEKPLVDGDIVVAFARIEAPFSYIDAQHAKSTVTSYDYGKPVTRKEVEDFLRNRPLPTIHLPPRTNRPPVLPKTTGVTNQPSLPPK